MPGFFLNKPHCFKFQIFIDCVYRKIFRFGKKSVNSKFVQFFNNQFFFEKKFLGNSSGIDFFG